MLKGGGSRWPRGPRRWFAAAPLLGLGFRIPPVAWMSVSVFCCQVKVSESGWSLVQRNRIKCGVSECDREASRVRRPWLTRGCCAMGKKYILKFIMWHVLRTFPETKINQLWLSLNRRYITGCISYTLLTVTVNTIWMSLDGLQQFGG